MRFGAGYSADLYGRPIAGALAWACEKANTPRQIYRTTVDLGVLQPGDVVLPSLSILKSDNVVYQCSVTADGQRWTLPAVAGRASLLPTTHAPAPFHPTGSGVEVQDAPVTTHIDFFAVHDTLDNAQIELVLGTDVPPQDYLLAISVRPKTLDTIDLPDVRTVSAVPALSQMTQPELQRHRTCSPTSVAMLMAHYNKPFFPNLIDRCKDPATGLYGVWPLNILHAGARGFAAGAELLPSWAALGEDPAPFVASIAFEQGQLSGSPLAKTAGHLVVVCGVTEHSVVCNDPAAPTASEVRREYDVQQFSAAWLRQRGAAYFIRPTPALKETA